MIVGLSYRGDVRLGLAEDPHKVSRIAQGSGEALRALYLPLMKEDLGQAVGARQAGQGQGGGGPEGQGVVWGGGGGTGARVCVWWGGEGPWSYS